MVTGVQVITASQVQSIGCRWQMLIFSKYKYLHVKIANLANVKSCITVGPISLMANVWPCIVPVDYLSGLAL